MLGTARRTGRRLAASVLMVGVLASACTASRDDAEPPGSGSTTSSSDNGAGSSTPVSTAPASTSPPDPTSPPRPTISPAQWRALDDELAIRLMSGGDYAASWAVSIDGEVAHTGAIGDRVPTLPPPPTTTTTSIAPPVTTASTTTTTSSTSTTTTTTSTTTTTTTTTTLPPTTDVVSSTTDRRRPPSGRSTTTDAPSRTTSTTRPRTSRTTTTRAPTTTLPPTTTTMPDLTADASDKFRIASISKVLTATVALQLVTHGELALDEPITPTLAAALGVTIVDPAVATITVRHLLSHTSGYGTYDNTFFRGGVDSCRQAAERGLTGNVQTPPGTAYHYSNMNFCILGLLIEQTAGEPYEQVVIERLLEPLGIEDMRLAGTFDPRPNEVQHPSVPNRNYMETLGAAGAWVASAEDVVRILDSLDPTKPGWHPLADNVLLAMRVAADGVAYPNIDDRWYGLGLIVFADGSWGHTGTIENTHAMVLNRPDGITWSILVSGNHPEQTTRLREIFDEAVAAADLPLVPES